MKQDQAPRRDFLCYAGTLAALSSPVAAGAADHRLRVSRVEQASELQIEEGNQFARELDHVAQCLREDKEPHTPGEEGLQDQRVIEAIYASARTGRPVKLTPPGKTRGPEPEEQS